MGAAHAKATALECAGRKSVGPKAGGGKAKSEQVTLLRQ
jgi:hypothetical protein